MASYLSRARWTSFVPPLGTVTRRGVLSWSVYFRGTVSRLDSTEAKVILVGSGGVTPGGQSFFRTYGALLGAEALAFAFGVLYWLLRAIFRGT